jgi:hypothetical protein
VGEGDGEAVGVAVAVGVGVGVDVGVVLGVGVDVGLGVGVDVGLGVGVDVGLGVGVDVGVGVGVDVGVGVGVDVGVGVGALAGSKAICALPHSSELDVTLCRPVVLAALKLTSAIARSRPTAQSGAATSTVPCDGEPYCPLVLRLSFTYIISNSSLFTLVLIDGDVNVVAVSGVWPYEVYVSYVSTTVVVLLPL